MIKNGILIQTLVGFESDSRRLFYQGHFPLANTCKFIYLEEYMFGNNNNMQYLLVEE